MGGHDWLTFYNDFCKTWMEVHFSKQAVFSKFQGMEGFYLSKKTHKKNMIQGHSNSVIVRMMK